MSLKKLLKSPLNPHKKITIGQVILNCSKLGRPFRRNLCRKLLLSWAEFKELEEFCLSKQA